ncbi:FHA domain-containing protein [Hoeflea sp.]|jgi:FHA domain-containing protein/RDD family protein|uniref:FHA domain-containing protein n=1 Tax=Hoeflea sp. TaxID=1940281 RepID=UPI003A8FB29B
MKEANERAVARLSIAAFAVDALVVTLLVAIVHQLVERNMPYAPQWIYILVIPVVLLVHFLIVEMLARGVSVGRLCSGIRIVEERTGAAPGVAARFKRCMMVLTRGGGLPSLNINALPAYNKHPSGCLHSDWAGRVAAVTRATSQKRESVPEIETRAEVTPVTGVTRGEAVLQINSGPHAGQTATLRQSQRFKTKGLYVIGRKPGVDLVLGKDANISGVHCQIRLHGGLYYLADGAGKDKPSTNGTRLNDKAVSAKTPVVLKNGDIIGAGSTNMRLILI